MTYIPRAVCVKCKRDYRVTKNEVVIHMLTGEGSYCYSVMSDKWACPSCGHEVLIGFALQPFVRSSQTDGKIPYNLKDEEVVVKL
jgi:DNA-directed RNA polymerase subunit RPC12/RpoP